MNKGIFVHIVATIIYILFVLYITGDTVITLKARILIVMLMLFSNLLTAMACDINDWYKEKI